jgi:archaellin
METRAVKKLAVILAVVLIGCVLAAGCTEEPPVETVPVFTYAPGQVLYETGDVTGDGTVGGTLTTGTIDTITFTIGLVPGQTPVNIEDLSIVYADAVRTESLIPVEGYYGNPPQGTWGVLEVKNEIGNPNNRLSDKELLVIRINPSAPLVPRQLITIGIRPPAGQPLTIRRISPPTIIKENNILAPV